MIAQDSNDVVLGADKTSVFTEVVKPVYENPSRLIIGTQSMDVALVQVDVAPDGTLEAPKDWFAGGWYIDGAKAGEPGNLIIDGHLDTNTGAPAAFWNLKNVKPGDIVTVVDDVGRTFDYIVTKSLEIDINDPNRLQIFDENRFSSENSNSLESKDIAHVTLITCAGDWLAGTSTYSKRWIIKGEMAE